MKSLREQWVRKKVKIKSLREIVARKKVKILLFSTVQKKSIIKQIIKKIEYRNKSRYIHDKEKYLWLPRYNTELDNVSKRKQRNMFYMARRRRADQYTLKNEKQ